MINYTYRFLRDEKDSVVELSPVYKSPFFNVSNLKGNSSTGKSTLMNLIALAFWGYDDLNIQQSLRNRIRYIYDSEKIQLDFDIEIVSVDGSVLKSHVIKKNNGDSTRSNVDIKVRFCDNSGNERPIFKEEFRQKYRLIYDIPDNPTKRIDESLNGIYNAQIKYHNKLGELKKTVVDTQTSIRNSKDSKKITECENKIAENKDLKNKDELTLSTIKAQIDSLRKYYWASILIENYEKMMELDKKIKKINKETRNVKKINREQSALYKTAIDNHVIEIGRLNDCHKKSVDSLNKIKSYGEIDTILIDTWADYNFNHANLTVNVDVPGDYFQNAKNLIYKLGTLRDKYDSKQDDQKYDLLKSIIDLLIKCSSDDQRIVILDKTTDAICSELEIELKEIEEKVSIYRAYNDALNYISASCQQASKVHQSFTNIPEKPIDEEIPEASDNLLNQSEYVLGEISRLEKNASGFGVSNQNAIDIVEQSESNPLLAQYIHLSIQEINNSLAELVVEEERLNDRIDGPNGYNNKIKFLEGKLSELQSCKDHPLSRHIERIDTLVTKLNGLQSDLGKKNGILEKIVNREKNLINFKQGSEEDIYLRQVWNNLGRRFGHIRHMGQEYEIMEVNIMDSRVVTTTGKEFSINDMGTGESQRAYLMNVLNSNQKTHIIAMFDESENMDYDLRHEILVKFKELYDGGHLILGLTASHHAGSNAEPIVEEFHGD